MTSRRALLVLIAFSALVRLIWAAMLGPGNDEAYHYLFAVHRDWSYFDHPPMLALVERIGITLSGGTVTPLTLRLGFIALFAGSTWLMARLTARFFGERAGFLAAFALNVTGYHTAAAAVFALPDGPLLFFWLLTLDQLASALSSPGPKPIMPWVGVGCAWGAAMLSKYHAIFLPAGTLLYLVAHPTARHWLRRPGPYIAAIVGLVIFSPVLAWNATHGWSSFAFQAGRALGGPSLRLDTLLSGLIGPAIYLFPWIWARLLIILVSRGRHVLAAATAPTDRFLICQAVLPLGTFVAVACVRPVLPHWTLVGFLPLFPMLGQAWERAVAVDSVRMRRRLALLATVPLLIVTLVAIHARTGFFQVGRMRGIGLVPVAQDPTVDMVGWNTVATELRRLRLLDEPESFLFTSSWYHSGQLAFATRASHTPVLCYHAWDARSFAFWSKPEEWVGRDGILLAFNDNLGEPDCYDKWFERIEPLGAFEVERGGVPLRKVRLYRCRRQTLAFPFDDLGANIRPKGQRDERRVASELPGHPSNRVR
jgi:4-amino-4-deoxy-L-arabinose transferase-like glycosyltransferase